MYMYRHIPPNNVTTLRQNFGVKMRKFFAFIKKGGKQVSAKKFVPNKKGDVGMSHPKSYVTDLKVIHITAINIGLRI